MATMKTLNGYGFNATELGGKAPEYYLQPRNLLDNSDFRNPVNQRGVSNVATYGYAIDRWFVQHIGGGLSFSDDGVTINATNSLFVFFQKVSKEIRKVLIGKTVTVAATDSSGNVGISTGTIPNFGEDVDTLQNSIGDTGLKVNIYTTSNDDTLYIRLLSDSILSPVTIVNIALYEGSYTADTLPPYVPKGYVAELAECQRYFWLCDNSYFSEGCGYAFSPTECRFMIPTPQTMRISPTIIADNGDTTSYGIKLIINGTVLTPTSVSVRRANNRLCLTLGGNFTRNAVGVMRIESQLSFSADL